MHLEGAPDARANKLQRSSLLLALAGFLLLPAAASPLVLVDFLAPFALVFLVLGAIGLILSFVMKDTIKAKNMPIAVLVSLVLVVVGILPMVGGPGVVTPPAELFKFELIPSVDTTGGDTIPAGNYDSCDTEAGGTTAEWTTTEGTYDAGAKTFTANIAIDTDNAITAALWMEPDCLQMSFSIRLLNGRDANGDGATDAVNYFMRIASISRTTLATDGSNGTLNTAGFARDGVSETNDWLLLYRTDASTWVASCPEARQGSQVPTSCGFVNIGNHAGAAADTTFAYIILEDRGLFGYQEPAVGSTVVIVYEFGGPSVETQSFTLLVRLNTRAATNLT